MDSDGIQLHAFNKLHRIHQETELKVEHPPNFVVAKVAQLSIVLTIQETSKLRIKKPDAMEVR